LGKRNAQETTAQLLAGNSEVFNDGFSNYPNPFNAGTTISFSLPQAGQASLVVYNTHGQRVVTLISERELAAGHHQIVWNGKNEYAEEIASGIYLCRLTSGNYVKLIRLVMIK
jgi:flagellar hook assembly protein FlgD